MTQLYVQLFLDHAISGERKCTFMIISNFISHLLMVFFQSYVDKCIENDGEVRIQRSDLFSILRYSEVSIYLCNMFNNIHICIMHIIDYINLG